MKRLAIFALVAGSACACNGPASNGTFTITGPSRASFPPVADALEAHCGTLDCHGQVGRNLRIYGLYGLRINGITGRGATTQEEYDATYTSLMSVQPEMLALVLSQRGANPQRWIVFSKGSGLEHHKGGTPMPVSSPSCTDSPSPCAANACVRSWLSGSIDDAACQTASEYLSPEPP